MAVLLRKLEEKIDCRAVLNYSPAQMSKTTTSAIAFHALKINELSCQVRLGCGPEERAQTQEVRFSVELRFAKAPSGTTTDEIGDTVCYGKMAELIRAHCEKGEFRLIERLASEVFLILRGYVGDQATLGLSLRKMKPPVEGLIGGSAYACGDFLL